MKDEERIQLLIFELLQIPANRRCINCNILGPRYVCTTFWTFVCTNCSGIHREFAHRVKSLSTARFTHEEVGALQAGGNERVREIYFKAWDPQLNSLPESNNLQRLRDFIKHVYVDRKYMGERITEVPRLKKGHEDDYPENRKSNGSPISAGSNHERRFRCYNPCSPRQSGAGYRSRSVHFEVVDDRFKDDRPGMRPGNGRAVNMECRHGSIGKDHHDSPASGRPIDVLQQRASNLGITDITMPHRDNINETHEPGASSDLKPTDNLSEKVGVDNLACLIDFGDDSVEPSTSKNDSPPIEPTSLTSISASLSDGCYAFGNATDIANYNNGPKPPYIELEPYSRKELPEDLFANNCYPPGQIAGAHCLMPATVPKKSTNPFD